MSDTKYGRLFTEDDVKTLLRVNLNAVHDDVSYSDEHVQQRIDNFDGKFPQDEPLFLVRAQDQLAADLIQEYYYAVMDANCSAGHIEAVNSVHSSFQKFADDNPDKMKRPD